jgi:hypothetical protein
MSIMNEKEMEAAAEVELQGSIITIMGVPKTDDPESFNALINNVTQAVAAGMNDWEVAHIPNTVILTEVNLKKADDEENNLREALFDSPAGRAAASILQGALITNDLAEEAEEKKRWEALTPEQQAAEKESNSAWVRNLYERTHESCQKERKEGVEKAFAIAENWASKENLTPRELCHGVAHDFYKQYGKVGDVDPANGKHVDVDPSQDYSIHYDTQFGDQIAARSQRAAKELFGG